MQSEDLACSPIVPGWQTNIVAHIEQGDPDRIKFMYDKINKPRTTRAPGLVIHGAASQTGRIGVGLERFKINPN